MSQILFPVAASIVTRFTTDFNNNLSTTAQTYGVDPFTIDFTGSEMNFFQSRFNILDLYQDAEAQLPAICLYEAGDQNQNIIALDLFSGPVQFGIDVHLVWTPGTKMQTMHLLRYAVHDAVITTMNSSAGVTDFLANSVAYNKRIAMQPPGQMLFVPDDGVWLQTLPFVAQFTYHTT